MEEEKKGLKIAKFTPVVIALFGLFYIVMMVILPKDSQIWSRLLSFAPYIFGSNVIVELLVGANKYKEKSMK